MKFLRLLALGFLCLGTVDVAYGMDPAASAATTSSSAAASSRSERPMPMRQAKKLLADKVMTQEQFDDNKQAIIDFYTLEVEVGISGFQREVKAIVHQKWSELFTQDNFAGTFALVDIDQTLLSSHWLSIEQKFVTVAGGTGKTPNFLFRTKLIKATPEGEHCDEPIWGVISLCKEFQKRSGHLVLCSTRQDDPEGEMRAAVLANLAHAGLNVTNITLILRDPNATTKPVDFKREQCQRISNDDLRLVCQIGDERATDFPSQDSTVVNINLPEGDLF